MYLALETENFLRSRYPHIVGKLLAEMPESGPPARARKNRKPCAARAAMEIEAYERPEAAERSQARRQDRIDIRIAFEDLPEPLLDHNGNRQISPKILQYPQSGSGQHTVAERPQPENGHAAPARQSFENSFHRLFFDFGFIDQHDGYIVPNGINAVALDALQSALIGLHLERRFAEGADQNFEQILMNSHLVSIQFINRIGTTPSVAVSDIVL
jgi:hypothetical protein